MGSVAYSIAVENSDDKELGPREGPSVTVPFKLLLVETMRTLVEDANKSAIAKYLNIWHSRPNFVISAKIWSACNTDRYRRFPTAVRSGCCSTFHRLS